MKLANKLVMINNPYEDKIFIYDRIDHIKYEINIEMFDLISSIHNNKLNYEESIKEFDQESIDQLIEMGILIEDNEEYIPNIKNLTKQNNARIFIEITDKCNLNCKHCYGGFACNNTNYLSLDTLENLINQGVELGTYEFDITGGEPLLYKDLETVLEKLYKSGMLVSIFTNLTLMTNKHLEMFKKYGVKKIITSIDSCYPEIHDTFRGGKGSFEKTIKNLKEIKESGIEVAVNTMIGNHNLDYIDEMISFLQTLEVQFVLDVITNEGRAVDLTEDMNIAASTIKEIFYKYNDEIDETANYKHCGIGDRFIYVKSNNKIYICPSLAEEEYCVGELTENFNLNDIWQNMINKFGTLSCEKQCKKCKKCKGGCRARALKMHGSINAIDDVYCTIMKGE
jgi:radical SAM protein with 4Fe4S-binding SPASM domain